MICADFESILIPENNRYKLVCIAVHKLINGVAKESKYYSCMMKKHFNKELVMIKEDN